VKGFSYEQFERSRLVQDAVMREITIIGEAARHISSSLKKANPEIPWSSIIGMRNILIHEYFEIDVPEVWKTVQADLPVLKMQLSQVVRSMKETGEAPS
jgi:uncharacterized protein with HEPN domain